MKVAVCISGQPRSYLKGYEYLKKNLLDHHDCDIFIHTWQTEVVDIDSVIGLYEPRAVCVEEFPADPKVLNERYTNTPDPVNYPPANAALSYYSLFQAGVMKRRAELIDGVYDAVVKTRFDYALNRTLPLDQIEHNRVYIPNCRMVPSRDFGNDQFAFGKSSVMDRYMSTFMHMDHFYDLGVRMNGEEMMCATLRFYNLIGPNLEYVDMNNPFPPGKYNGTPHSLIRDDMELWK